MGRSGSADLPLHGGRVPPWLATRMATLGRVLVEALVLQYGRDEVLRRLAHPFWFQSLGCVMGMDWHSSGITTSVLGALKRGLAPVENELGIHVCGGRGRQSRRTPDELRAHAERIGFDGDALARTSKLVAKVDSAAIQDGYQLYLHGFVVTDDGKWTVVQQGMRPESKTARRYHWLSEKVSSFVDEPHAAIAGPAHGALVNLVDRRAAASQAAQLALVADGPDVVLRELARLPRFSQRDSSTHNLATHNPATHNPATRNPATHNPALNDPSYDPQLARATQSALNPSLRTSRTARNPTQLALDGSLSSDSRSALEDPSLRNSRSEMQPHLSMPDHHDVRANDVLLRRMHGTLAAAAARAPHDFAELLLTPGLGARTVQALALVAEVMHGAPCRFTDPARFSLAHGGKDGHPFPVPLRVYHETLRVMRQAVDAAKLGNDERLSALKRLDAEARRLEATASGPSFNDFIDDEEERSAEFGGRTVFEDRAKPRQNANPQRSGAAAPNHEETRQLALFPLRKAR